MQFILCSDCFTPSQSGVVICPNCGINIQDLPKVHGSELEGAVFEDRYQLDNYLDEGAMAWVYKGIHMELGSSVAIKILKPSFQDNDNFLARFKKEAMAASALNHPNILSVITSGTTPSKITYIISEFIRGTSLAGLLRNEGKLSLERTVRIVGQILSALDEAHAKGIIHRDLKPENVMVTTLRSGEDFTKLVDFGIAKETHSNEPRLTKHGELFGTPEYMAPEVIKGREATNLSDLYAIGIITYELLTGELPFKGEVIFDILKAHLETTPPNVSQKCPDIPLEIDALVMQAMSKDPAERPVSAVAFKKALSEYFHQSRGLVKCKVCSHHMDSSHKFCPNCGHNTQTATQAIIPSNIIPDTRSVSQKLSKVPPVEEGDPSNSQVTETLSRILFNENMLEPLFIGRERELDLITSFLYGERIVLELNGPQGIGKSTLARHILKTQINAQIIGYSAGSDPTYTARPWYPVRKIFTKILNLDNEFGCADVESALSAIHLERDDIPHILKLMGCTKEVPLERNVAIREVITSAIRVILAVCREQPTLLIFDDIDEYDFPSRLFIDKLIGTIQGFPIKIIVTCESTFLDKTQVSDAIILTRLDQKDINPILLQLAAKSTQSWHGLIDMLLSSSMGLPLHISEGAHLLLEGGSEVSSNLVDLVTLRLNRLPSMGIKILQIAALYGKETPTELIYDYMRHDPLVQKTLEVLAKRGFITQETPFTVEFVHPIFAEVLTATMTGLLKTEFHSFIYNWLIQKESTIYLIARHILKSNRLEEAVEFLELAGDEFELELDDYGAVTYMKHAYDIAKILSLRGEHIEQFTRISIKLGDLLRFTGQFLEAETVLKEGLLFSEGKPDTEARILSSLARLALISSDSGHKKASSLINRAAKLARMSEDSSTFYRVFFDLSSIEGEMGEFASGANMLREGLHQAGSNLTSDPMFWRLFLKLAEFEFNIGRQDDAIRILMDGLSVIDDSFKDFELAKGRIHYLLGQFFLHLGKQYDAIPHLEMACTFLQRIGDRKSAAEAALLIAENHHNVDENLKKAVYLSMQIGWRQGLEKARSLGSEIPA